MRNFFFYWFGLLVGTANGFRRRIFGYGDPRPIAVGDIEKNIDYDRSVVEGFERRLRDYLGEERPFEGKRTLEIGPGPDMGTGILLLAKGAVQYTAVDRFSLLEAPRDFYVALHESLAAEHSESSREAVHALLEGKSDLRLSFIRAPAECFSAKLGDTRFDYVMSQAALEHVDDLEAVFRETLSALASGGVMCHEIDFRTHSGILRDRDPLNIYRYSEPLYERFLRFPGAPNRVGPQEVVELAQAAGFRDVCLKPLLQLSLDRLHTVRKSLAWPFQNRRTEDLVILTAMLFGRKPL